MRQRIERRRAKLPPILEIDEDGVAVAEGQEAWSRPSWSSDEDRIGFQLEDWPADFDD